MDTINQSGRLPGRILAFFRLFLTLLFTFPRGGAFLRLWPLHARSCTEPDSGALASH